ncbi:MAG: glycerol-3-phosphate dehydrogenase/oxidase [Thermodesulfobacteriota bacterium]|nr:glycerol-3-phosphate dehydrogenase/oxidase [Thermodesulfobacteriota bacterium]
MKTELMSWSTKRRPEYLEQLCETTYDVLIIGGGITGAGILRECGLQGIKAALIEKDDFAFGTSSKSTRLAHGGARYIVNLEFGLVREETHERDWMRNAFPNMVRPVPIIYANYNATESRALRIYFKVYDALSGWKNYKNTRHLSKKEIETLEPNLKFPGLHSGSLLYECIINDARLTIEVVKEGVMSGGAAVNYVRAKRVVTKNERAVGVEAQDRETGRILNINAGNIINATGSWTDDLLPKGYRTTGRLIRPAKGVHIVVKRESIGNMAGLYVKNPADKRGVFVLAHGDFTYLGTTDTDYEGDLDHCYTEVGEYEYFKEIVDHCFPNAKFESEDLLGTYAGTRPLVLEEGVSEDKTSRREFIDELMPGFFVIAGGKLTIFRSMAEKLLSFMASRGATSIKKPRKSLSKSPFILGITKDDWDDMTQRALTTTNLGLDEKTAEHIYQNYGKAGIVILESVKANPSLGEKITYDQPNIRAELDYALEYEMITHVKDFLLRRTNISLYQRDDHEELGRKIAEHMASRLGWDDKQVDKEVADYVEIAHKNKFFLNK